MKQTLGGNGSNTTAAVQALLEDGSEFALPNLYLIGEPEDPMALWLTDWESPLCWPVFTSLKTATPVAGAVYANAFDPAVITRGKVTSKFGLDVDTLDITWNPRIQAFGTSVATASPLQLAQTGYYDNATVRVWTAYLPTPQSGSYVYPGDCNTFGCSQLFGGYIGDTSVGRNSIKFTVNSFLVVVNKQVPLNVIEATNMYASFAGATPPAGLSAVPTLTVHAGSTQQNLIAQWSGGVFTSEVLVGGFIIMAPGTQNSQQTVAIAANSTIVVSAVNYNYINLAQPLGFQPNPGDTFVVSGQYPISQNAAQWDSGFPYAQNAQVLYAGSVYVSIQASNTGNTPGSSPSWWQLQPFGGFPFVPAPQSVGG